MFVYYVHQDVNSNRIPAFLRNVNVTKGLPFGCFIAGMDGFSLRVFMLQILLFRNEEFLFHTIHERQDNHGEWHKKSAHEL